MMFWFASLALSDYFGRYCCSLTIRRVESALLAESWLLVKGQTGTVPPATFDCVTRLQLCRKAREEIEERRKRVILNKTLKLLSVCP
ncbi:hypothetical protein [Roseateles depolymerans]|uniref:hypothetical protein n=1 Tax=Roseateles depolymerans TaxID=76731 RepID=UPI0011C04411|nr:hypothetical protein [Roseateles depolymerans]